MDSFQEIIGLALCFGAGGLELGIKIALPNYRAVALSEGEAYALAQTAARVEEDSMDECLVAPDLRELDARPFRGRIGILSAGFPCQPHSVAGKRQGTEDERWLWPDIARIIDECQPGLVFLENVAGLLRDASSDDDPYEDLGESPDDAIGGMGTVLRDLAESGYDAEWICLRASDVGAAHQRARVFILAYRNSPRWAASWFGRFFNDGWQLEARSGQLADTQSTGSDGLPQRTAKKISLGQLPSGDLADTSNGQLPQPWRGSSRRNGAGSAESELGNPTNGRRGISGEPSEGYGQPHRPNEVLDDASGQRSAVRLSTSTRGNEEPAKPAEPKHGVNDPEDSARNERNGSHRQSGERRGVSQAGDELAHAGIVADAPEHTSGKDRGRDSIGSSTELEIFAPGPASPDWPTLLVQYPWLRPSVSQAEIESPFCNLAHGLADLVGSNRTDALRALGNGVVPLQCAAAFTELLRRVVANGPPN